jgi:uncharacterized protein YccT (UPF0319 family)
MFKVTLSKEYNIPLLRVHDRKLMDAVVETGCFTSKQLIINRVRHYKKVSSIADMVLFDNLTIDPEMLDISAVVSTRDFATQRLNATEQRGPTWFWNAQMKTSSPPARRTFLSWCSSNWRDYQALKKRSTF